MLDLLIILIYQRWTCPSLPFVMDQTMCKSCSWTFPFLSPVSAAVLAVAVVAAQHQPWHQFSWWPQCCQWHHSVAPVGGGISSSGGGSSGISISSDGIGSGGSSSGSSIGKGGVGGGSSIGGSISNSVGGGGSSVVIRKMFCHWFRMIIIQSQN